ncbi:MAG: phosphatase PAP2 family protein, partial [Propionibacteriales bacterium]|nr:phosphatase PAP2 family protein [Propionibacteriales bacterium]
MNQLRHIDDRLFFAVNSLARHTTWLHASVVTYANSGIALFGLLLVAGLLYARSRDSRTLGAAGWAGMATLVALAVNQPVSHLFHEPRPYVTHTHLLVLVARSPDYSFPSDHTVMAGAVAMGLFLTSRRLGLLAAGAGLLMAFARVYVAAHYPWDVLAGLLLGAAVAGLGWLLLRMPLTTLAAWLRSRPGLSVAFAPTERLRGTHARVGAATSADTRA